MVITLAKYIMHAANHIHSIIKCKYACAHFTVINVFINCIVSVYHCTYKGSSEIKIIMLESRLMTLTT